MPDAGIGLSRAVGRALHHFLPCLASARFEIHRARKPPAIVVRRFI
jgi:hypothetical protein